jgi:hypothetical protein
MLYTTTKKMMPKEGDNPLSLRVTMTITTEFRSNMSDRP